MNNRSSTSDAILACTRKLIVGGGYNSFSYADIAEVVGIRKPNTVYLVAHQAASDGIAPSPPSCYC